MVSCGNLLKSVLVAVVLVTLPGSGSAQWKHSGRCEEVSSKEITEPIIGYKLQKGNPPCVPAVIFLTEKGHFCTYIRAPWVMDKVNELKGKLEASARAASTPSSLLSIITSTSSPPSFSSS